MRVSLDGCGIEEVRTAYRSPWQSLYIERYIGTMRRELLDHVIVLGETHLGRLLREYIDEYYHVARFQWLLAEILIADSKKGPLGKRYTVR